MDTNIKIEIKTENKRHHYDISLLVDKPDFIDYVLDLRKKWKIDSLFRPENYMEFYSHIWKVSGKDWSSFLKDIEKIRMAFERLPNFDEVIIYAIAFTEIPDGIYKSCYLETIPEPSDPENEIKYKYAIIVTPNTMITDISKVLSEFKKKIKIGLKQKGDEKVMEDAVAEYKFELGPNYNPTPRGIDNIIRDRNWYWQYKSGLSYQKVWEATPRNQRTANRDGVIKAIKAYRKRLV